MSAVLAKPKAQRAAAAAAPATPVTTSGERERNPRNLLAAFDIVVDSLEAASETDEKHDRSGDSDRILRIAASDADKHGAQANTAESARELAFDLAALIKSSRRVPGDVASPERIQHLVRAVAQLAWMADIDAADLVPTITHHGAALGQAPAAPGTLMPDALHDFLSLRFSKASAILCYLVPLFSGDANTDSPGRQPGLPGTLRHVEQLLRSTHAELLTHANVLPAGLLDAADEADSLIKLLHSTERCREYDFNLGDSVYCSYFDAALECVDRALVLMDTVRTGVHHG